MIFHSILSISFGAGHFWRRARNRLGSNSDALHFSLTWSANHRLDPSSKHIFLGTFPGAITMYGDVPNFALGPVVLVHPAMKEYLMAWFGGIILKYTAVVFERSAALVSSHPPASYEPCFKASIYLHFAKRQTCQMVLAETILQDTVKRGRRRGRQKKRWEDNIREWTDRPGVRQVPEGSGEQGKMEKTGYKIICGAKTTLAVKG